MNKKINCSRFALPLVTGLLVTTSMNASAAAVYTGSISTPGANGLVGNQSWASGSSLSWNVSQDMQSNLWTYDYTLSVASKAISHFTLGLCAPVTLSDLSFTGSNNGTSELTTFSPPSPSDPGLPGDLYGLKINTTGAPTSLTFSIQSAKAPGWGDFYAKGGRDGGQGQPQPGDFVYMYNSGFSAPDPSNPAADGSLNGHVLVPCFDGPPIIPPIIPPIAIPEPSATLALAFLLMTGLSTRRRS